MDLEKIVFLEEKWIANCTDELIVFKVGGRRTTVMPCGLSLPTIEDRQEYLLALPGSTSFRIVYRSTELSRLALEVLTWLYPQNLVVLGDLKATKAHPARVMMAMLDDEGLACLDKFRVDL